MPGTLGDLRRRPQVDHGPDVELGQAVAAGDGEAVQRVCAVDHAAAHLASVGGDVAAEIAEVEASVQLNESGIGIGCARLMPCNHRAKLTGCSHLGGGTARPWSFLAGPADQREWSRSAVLG